MSGIVVVGAKHVDSSSSDSDSDDSKEGGARVLVTQASTTSLNASGPSGSTKSGGLAPSSGSNPSLNPSGGSTTTMGLAPNTGQAASSSAAPGSSGGGAESPSSSDGEGDSSSSKPTMRRTMSVVAGPSRVNYEKSPQTTTSSLDKSPQPQRSSTQGSISLKHVKASLMKNLAVSSVTKKFEESLIDRVKAAKGTVMSLTVSYHALPGGGNTFETLTIEVKDDWTALMVLETVAERIRLEDWAYFDLCDVSDPAVEKWLDLERSLKGSGLTTSSKVALKTKLWVAPIDFADPVHLNLFYAQVVHHIRVGMWATADVRALRLASYAIQGIVGDFSDELPTDYITEGLLAAVMPQKMVASMPASYFQTRLKDLHSKYVGQFADASEAMLKYIELARQLPTFGLTFFAATDSTSRRVSLATAADGLFLYNDGGSLLAFTPFSQLRGWRLCDTTTLEVRRYVGAEDGGEDEETARFALAIGLGDTLVELLTVYFLMNVQSQERTEEGVEKRLAAVDIEDCRWRVPDVALFMPLERRKVMRSSHTSRLEVLKSLLRENFALSGTPPIVSLWKAVDNALDNNKWLEDVDLSMAQISDATLELVTHSFVEAFDYKQPSGEKLIENVKVESFNISSNLITLAGCPSLAQNLPILSGSLRTLTLYGNAKISNKGMASLGPGLCKLSLLESLNLSACDIGNKGMYDILLSVRTLSRLSTLILRRNRIGDDHWPELATPLLSSHPSLTLLDLNYNKLSDVGVDALVNGFAGALVDKVSWLDLGNNKFSSKALGRLLRFAQGRSALQVLKIANAKTGSDTGTLLADLVGGSPSLLELDVTGLALGKAGVKALMEATAQNNRLLSLCLDRSGVDGKSASDLADMLAVNGTLTSLSLADCKLGGYKANFAAMLSRNTQLISLDLSGNGLKTVDVASLADGITLNRTLRLLNLDNNGFGNAGLEALCGALGRNSGLSSVSLSANKIGDPAIVLLVGALKDNKTLANLCLSHNAVTNKAFPRFLDGLASSSLEYLNLQGNKLTDLPVLAEELDAHNITVNVIV